MSTIHCALYSTFAAKYRAQYPLYAMSNLVPVKSNIISVLLKLASTYNCTYLRCDRWFIDKSVRVIFHTFCLIQSTISGLRYVRSGLGKMLYNYNSCYSGCNIQLTVNPTILVMCRQFNGRYTPLLQPNAVHNIRFKLFQFWSRSNPI
jgi:hypothetical protein